MDEHDKHSKHKKSHKSSSSRSRSRSRSRSQEIKAKKSNNLIILERVSKWSDGPVEQVDTVEKLNPLLAFANEIMINTADSTKIKRKIYIPKQQGVNFVGLLIGPKGSYQKRLEAQTNCKILIRGK
jgi:hypothetical protein